MKTWHTNIPAGSTISPPPTFGAGTGAGRMAVVHTISGAALCVEIIGPGVKKAPAIATSSSVSTTSAGFGGANQILKKQVGHIRRGPRGKPGGTSS